jgi:septum formation inhibitor MinC
MLGVEYEEGNSKQNVFARLKQEETFKSRLEKNQTKNAYETTLALIEKDIEKLNAQKSNFNLNADYEADLDKLTNTKYKINAASYDVTNLNIRHELILEAERELKNSRSDIDLHQLQIIYEQATQNIEGIQKTFEDLVLFIIK